MERGYERDVNNSVQDVVVESVESNNSDVCLVGRLAVSCRHGGIFLSRSDLPSSPRVLSTSPDLCQSSSSPSPAATSTVTLGEYSLFSSHVSPA